ncbi:MAG: hypothetical protein ACXADD_15270 [Candidatus Thorarchaeota archaeon]|jgi:hypothetical protein
MRRVGAALILMASMGSLLFLGVAASKPSVFPVNVLHQFQSEGPVIEWYNITGTEQFIIAWDGAYTGQTEEVWMNSRWVNDSDGIDTVIFRYRWYGETEWMNKTANQVEGNLTNGRYSANFTYSVWWNYDTGRPETEGSGGNFYFKIWAKYTGGYMFVEPPFDYIFWRTPLGWATIGIPVVIASIVMVWLVRRRT